MTETDRRQLRLRIDERRRELVGALPDGLMHGTAMAYRKGGCRCQACRGYAATYKRGYRLARVEQERAARKRYKARRKAASQDSRRHVNARKER